jgi:hypothetical protein
VSVASLHQQRLASPAIQANGARKQALVSGSSRC